MIRIIGGTHKGRKISAPSSLPVRPTTDYAKEGLFNVLNNRLDFEKIKALDLFAGTGNITYELASRGCESVLSVDADFGCVKFIGETAEKFGFSQVKVTRSDVYSFLNRVKGKFDFIFADPPYQQTNTVKLPEKVFANELLAPGGLLVIEHPVRLHFPDTSRLLETRDYGKVNFSFFG